MGPFLPAIIPPVLSMMLGKGAQASNLSGKGNIVVGVSYLYIN